MLLPAPPGKPLNFLVTNKWRNVEMVRRLRRDMPLLLLASEQVRVGAGGAAVLSCDIPLAPLNTYTHTQASPATVQDEMVPFKQMELLRDTLGYHPHLTWQVGAPDWCGYPRLRV